MRYKKIHPADLNSNNKAIGIQVPITLDNSNVFNQTYLTIDQIKSNIKNLLLTEQGERIMLPTYGVKFKHKLFDNIKEGNQPDLEHEIRNAVSTWMPYVTIDDIQITVDGYQITIIIFFSYLSESTDLSIVLNLE